jgi:chaperonin GroES
MIKVVGHRVLVKPSSVEKTTASGIIIADTTHEKNQRDQQKGTVIQIGPNAWKAFDGGEPWCDVGDLVLFSRYGGKIVKDGNEEFRILEDEDIVAIISEEVTT